jgi:CheY-like chemotaxis protein
MAHAHARRRKASVNEAPVLPTVSVAELQATWLIAPHMSRPLRLLVVEDHVDSAELLAELLQNHGHTVHVATNASDALALANQQPFDVLVSDLGLPDASGYELMQQLRSRFAMKGIAISGAARASDIEAGRVAGFSVHLTKPVSVRRLEQVLQELAG